MAMMTLSYVEVLEKALGRERALAFLMEAAEDLGKRQGKGIARLLGVSKARSRGGIAAYDRFIEALGLRFHPLKIAPHKTVGAVFSQCPFFEAGLALDLPPQLVCSRFCNPLSANFISQVDPSLHFAITRPREKGDGSCEVTFFKVA
ncbi:MAG: L-2-amino-thiazoline-4-carboxylic acid hydrolase, partial [Candidatus Methylomirabilales bacterium]